MRDVATLANGIRLCLDPMPSLETTAIGVWACAGAMDETPEENGVAHLLEHMAFKGTRSRSAREIAEAMEAVGGHINAATSYQTTGYYARILKDDAATAFDILSDILFDPAFDEEELEKEKDVVIQEIGEARDTPDDVVFEAVQSLTYADQALGRSILGDEASVGGDARVYSLPFE
ncbi:MAG: pitrilysin family protein, partial [Pseudomonadota bacterium]